MIHLYCVRRSSDPGPPGPLSGVYGAGVAAAHVGRLSAWYSEVDAAEPDRGSLAAHDAVVREALRTDAPVPFRFGSVFPGPGALRDFLRERERDLLALLARLSGCVEVAVRVRGEAGVAHPDPEAAERTGRDYLRAARERLTAARSARLSAEKTVISLLGQDGGVSDVASAEAGERETDVSLLVRRDRLVDVRARLEEACRAGGPIIASSGPWPPYTFASLTE